MQTAEASPPSSPSLPFLADRNTLLALFPPDLDWEGSAKQHKALQRARKVKTAQDLLWLILLYALPDLSLRETAATAQRIQLAAISDVALLNRFRKSKDWLAFLLGQLLPDPEPFPSSRRVSIVDGSTLTLPGDSSPSWRLHLQFELGSQTTRALKLTSTKTGESLTNFSFQAGELVLGDRAYAHRRGIHALRQVQAHALVRVPWKTFPLQTPAGEPLEWLPLLRTLKEGEVADFPVQLPAEPRQGLPAIPGRILALRLPEAKAAEARRRRKQKSKKKGHKVSKEALEVQGYLVLCTTLAREEASAKELLSLYRYRWQIECVFKRLKSLLQLSSIRADDEELVQTWIYAKLLGSLLLEKALHRWVDFFPSGFSVPLADHPIPLEEPLPSPPPTPIVEGELDALPRLDATSL